MRRCNQDEDLMWLVGYVDAYGAVHARPVTLREATCGSTQMHTQEERLAGRPFRWNVPDEGFGDALGGKLTLTSEDCLAVVEYVFSLGLIDADEVSRMYRVHTRRREQGK